MKLPNTGSKNRFLLPLLGCLPVAYFAALISPALVDGLDLAARLELMSIALENPFNLSWQDNTLSVMLFSLIIYAISIAMHTSTRRNERRREEYGSASWGNAMQISKRYQDANTAENLLFTKHFRMGLDGHKHRRNLNVLVVGGSGAGKTRFYAKPNILQCNCSFIITDPKAGATRS